MKWYVGGLVTADLAAADGAFFLQLALLLDLELLAAALEDHLLIVRARVMLFLLACIALCGDRVITLDFVARFFRARDAAALLAFAQARLDEFSGATCER